MITIILTVSRKEFLEKVLTSIELLDADVTTTNILCIVDGNDELFVKTRNLVSGLKYNNRLTVKFKGAGRVSRYSIKERRQRITDIHNYARSLINHTEGHVFSVEDDTTFGPGTLKKLFKIALNNRACGMVEGVELGRWGVPYVGGWIADDVYDPKVLTSIDNQIPVRDKVNVSEIDAGGLYCALIRADLYKQHTFTCSNGLGPDVNFALENRQLGFQNYIAWDVLCNHFYIDNGVEKFLDPKTRSTTIVMTKRNDIKWDVAY